MQNYNICADSVDSYQMLQNHQGIHCFPIIQQFLDTSVGSHYENTPIQIYRKFLLQKFKNFR